MSSNFSDIIVNRVVSYIIYCVLLFGKLTSMDLGTKIIIIIIVISIATPLLYSKIINGTKALVRLFRMVRFLYIFLTFALIAYLIYDLLYLFHKIELSWGWEKSVIDIINGIIMCLLGFPLIYGLQYGIYKLMMLGEKINKAYYNFRKIPNKTDVFGSTEGPFTCVPLILILIIMIVLYNVLT